MKRLMFGFCFGVMALAAQAATMVWDFAYLDLAPSCQWSSIMAYAEVAGITGGEGVGFKYACYTDRVTLHGYDHANAGSAMSWRVLNVGDEVSISTMTGKDKKYFYTNWINDRTGEPTNDYDIDVNVGDSVYLAFYTNDPGICGWVELLYDGITLAAGQSAMDWDRGPVVIRPHPTPEPCAAALLLLGACVCALRRKP